MKKSFPLNINIPAYSNPFQLGTCARGAGFYNRRSELERINLFIYSTGQYNMLLVGQRRIGKTSLLRRIQDVDWEHIYPVFYDLQDKGNIPLAQLLFELAEKISLELGKDLVYLKEQLQNPEFFINTFSKSLAATLKSEEKILFLFDEFDALSPKATDNPYDNLSYNLFIPFIIRWIEAIQNQNMPFKFIFAAGRNYKDLKQERYGNLLKSGIKLELTYFLKEDIEELIQGLSGHVIPFSSKAINCIYDITAGHPFFTQALASEVFTQAVLQKQHKITEKHIQSGYEAAVNSIAGGIEWFWGSFSAKQKIILYILNQLMDENSACTLVNLAKKGDSLHLLPGTDNAIETVKELINAQILNNAGGNKLCTGFMVPFFRRWIKQEVSLQEVIDLLDKLYDGMDSALNHGRDYYKKGNYKKALECFEEVLEKTTKHFESLDKASRSAMNLYQETNQDTAFLFKAIDYMEKAYLILPDRIQDDFENLILEIIKNPEVLKHEKLNIENIINCLKDPGEFFLKAYIRIARGEKSFIVPLLNTLEQSDITMLFEQEDIIPEGIIKKGKNALVKFLTMNDISIIHELEKTLGIKFRQVDSLSNKNNFITENAYVLDNNYITELSIYNQPLIRFPLEILQLKNLRCLVIVTCKLTAISKSLVQLQYLEELVLRNNLLSTLPENLCQLNTLDLSWNQIIDISMLKDLSQLKTLDLSDNQISDISVLKDLTQLTTLDLNNNQISDISVLKDLTQLSTGGLNNNKISRLPAWVVKRKFRIKNDIDTCQGYLTIRDNPLIHPPVGVVEQGHNAVERFFEQKAKHKTLTQAIEFQVKQDALFETYLTCTHNEHRHLPAKGFDLKMPVLITRIYVKMRAFLHAQSPKKVVSPADFPETGNMRTETGIVDMKQAFAILKKHAIKDMVILGDPGAGKTTLLKYITSSLIEDRGGEILGLNSRLIPFLGPLRELKDPQKEDFYSFISRVCCFDDRHVKIQHFKDLLEKGRAIILLDGLDEVAAAGKRLEVIQWIEKARNTHHNVHFIITSRFAGYTGTNRLDGNLLELAIDDFSPEEIKEFLYNWYGTVEGFLHGGDMDAKKKGEADAEILYNEIVGSKRLKAFVKNPLLLQITALVHRDRGHLPERRVELYEECTTILLEKWDMAKGLDVKIRAREARKILQPIALWLHTVDERRSAPLKEIIQVLVKPLEELGKSGVDGEVLLKNIRDRSGIFTGYSHDEYGFIHLSFQEYLAAEEIRNRGEINLLAANYADRWWREVILLTLALDNPSVIGEFVKKIITQPAFCKEITLVQDALRDSRIKPVAELEQGLSDKEISQTAKYRILTLLNGLAEDGVHNARDVLKKTVKGRDKKCAGFAESLIEGKSGIHITGEVDVALEIIHEKDGAKMVLIPAGSFLYGSKEDDKEARQDEKPQRVIELPAFYMDKYPVTNRQFCLFLNEKQPGSEKLDKWINLEGSYKKEKCRIGLQNRVFRVEKGYENFPVIYVSWYGAGAYTEWAGKKLPTEEEWEKAARGMEGRKYPWGDRWQEGMCNSDASGIGMTTPVDKFEQGKSVFGCYDMAGNVWEWTASFFDKNKDFYTVSGGAWYSSHDYCRCAARLGLEPRGRYNGLGFRCART